MVGLPVRMPREGGGSGGPTPSEQDQQAHLSNDVLAHWFLCRHSDAAHTKSPAEAGLSSTIGLATATTANPPTQYHSRLHSARENSQKKPRQVAGLSSLRGFAPVA